MSSAKERPTSEAKSGGSPLARVVEVFRAANKVIVAIGGLAVAITAVLLLLHELASGPDPKLRIGFGNVTVAEEVPLEEYEIDHRLHANAAYFYLADERSEPTDTRSSPATTTTTSTSTTITNVGGTGTGTGTGGGGGGSHHGGGAPGTSTTTPLRESPPLVPGKDLGVKVQHLKNATIKVGNENDPHAVAAVLADLEGDAKHGQAPGSAPPPIDGGTTSTQTSTTSAPGTAGAAPGQQSASLACEHCTLLPAIESALAHNHHHVQAAAHELRLARREWRKTNRDGTPELSGVEVGYSLELKGFNGQKVELSYVIRSKGRQLPKGWWGRHLVTDLTVPKGNEAVVEENFWALVPQRRGKYYLEMELLNSKGEGLKGTKTGDFS